MDGAAPYLRPLSTGIHCPLSYLRMKLKLLFTGGAAIPISKLQLWSQMNTSGWKLTRPMLCCSGWVSLFLCYWGSLLLSRNYVFLGRICSLPLILASRLSPKTVLCLHLFLTDSLSFLPCKLICHSKFRTTPAQSTLQEMLLTYILHVEQSVRIACGSGLGWLYSVFLRLVYRYPLIGLLIVQGGRMVELPQPNLGSMMRHSAQLYGTRKRENCVTYLRLTVPSFNCSSERFCTCLAARAHAAMTCVCNSLSLSPKLGSNHASFVHFVWRHAYLAWVKLDECDESVYDDAIHQTGCKMAKWGSK